MANSLRLTSIRYPSDTIVPDRRLINTYSMVSRFTVWEVKHSIWNNSNDLEAAVWQWYDSGASSWTDPRLHTVHVFTTHAMSMGRRTRHLLGILLWTSGQMGNFRRHILSTRLAKFRSNWPRIWYHCKPVLNTFTVPPRFTTVWLLSMSQNTYTPHNLSMKVRLVVSDKGMVEVMFSSLLCYV